MSGSSHTQEDAFGTPPTARTLRFYFDTDDGQTAIEDDEGIELDGLGAARLQAQSALADMARDAVPGDGDERTMSVRVRDEDGGVVLQATLTLCIEMRR